MKKVFYIRIFVLIIVLNIILITFSGCSDFIGKIIEVISSQTTNTTHITKPEETTHEPIVVDDYTWTRMHVGYDCLQTAEQQLCYNKMKTAVYNITSQESNNGDYYTEEIFLNDITLPSAEIRLVLTAFLEDHPEVFWISNTFEYSNSSSGTLFKMLSVYDGEQTSSMMTNFNAVIKNIINKIPKNSTYYEIELYLHDYIVNNCVYDKDAVLTHDMGMSSSAYGALVDGRAVCEGYAKAFTLLLSSVGIESINVTGLGKKELHLWTAVHLYDNWYYVDVTWDDSDTDSDASKHDYFNITTDELSEDHQIAKTYFEFTSDEITGKNLDYPVNFNLYVPECVDTSENYNRKNLAHIYDFSRNNRAELTDALYNAVIDGKDYISFFVETDLIDFDEAYSTLFTQQHMFFRYIDDVNDRLGTDYFIDKDNVRVSEKENVSVITIYISYE